MRLEVVRHMVPAQLAEVIAFQTEVVQRVAGHIVYDVTKQKAGNPI